MGNFVDAKKLVRIREIIELWEVEFSELFLQNHYIGKLTTTSRETPPKGFFNNYSKSSIKIRTIAIHKSF